jgi:hypothetical protein
MRIATLASALALAFAASGAQAAVAIGDTPAVDLYMTGASAPDTFLDSIFTSMFSAGFIKYIDNAGGSSYRAYFGEANGIPGIANGAKIRIVKRSAGGSVWGVNPVARATPVQTMGLTLADCTAGSGTVADPYKCKIKGADEGTATYVAANLDGDTLDGDADPDFNRAPSYGVSDVAPFMFKEPLNVEFGQGQLSAAESGALVFTGTGLVAMGFVATDNVPASTVLTRAAYGAMLTGSYRDWVQVDASLSGPVVVCRRHPGSGTQTSYNWYFNNFPCTDLSQISGTSGSTAPTRNSDSDAFALGVNGLPLDTDANGIPNCQDSDSSGTCDAGEPVGTSTDPFIVDPTAGYTVVENSGSGDVRTCLKNASTGVDTTVKAPDGTYFKYQFSNTPTGFGAIGVLSLDSLGKEGHTTTTSGTWSFRHVDGAGETKLVDTSDADLDLDDAVDTAESGTGIGLGDALTDQVDHGKANLLAGGYDFASEVTMQYKSGALSGDKLDFVTEFIKRAGSPTYNTQPWVAALPPNNTPFDDDPATLTVVEGEHVAKGSRFGNMCSPLQLLF